MSHLEAAGELSLSVHPDSHAASSGVFTDGEEAQSAKLSSCWRWFFLQMAIYMGQGVGVGETGAPMFSLHTTSTLRKLGLLACHWDITVCPGTQYPTPAGRKFLPQSPIEENRPSLLPSILRNLFGQRTVVSLFFSV